MVKSSGVRGATLHGTRHMAASYALASVADIVGISRHMGHSRTSTTTDMYGHPRDGADLRVAGGIADAILGRGERLG